MLIFCYKILQNYLIAVISISCSLSVTICYYHPCFFWNFLFISFFYYNKLLLRKNMFDFIDEKFREIFYWQNFALGAKLYRILRNYVNRNPGQLPSTRGPAIQGRSNLVVESRKSSCSQFFRRRGGWEIIGFSNSALCRSPSLLQAGAADTQPIRMEETQVPPSSTPPPHQVQASLVGRITSKTTW